MAKQSVNGVPVINKKARVPASQLRNLIVECNDQGAFKAVPEDQDVELRDVLEALNRMTRLLVVTATAEIISADESASMAYLLREVIAPTFETSDGASAEIGGSDEAGDQPAF